MENSPFKIDASVAEEAINKSPEPAEPHDVDTIGELIKIHIKLN